jgi:hypothetical protein
MFVEVAIPITAAMSFEINSLVILVMIVFWAVHEATAVWDVSYAADKREVTPIEQYVHSYLGVLPLMSLLLAVVLNWSQFLALFGLGTEAPRFTVAEKQPPLPWSYVSAILATVLLFEVLPYMEELIRGLRANHGRLVPPRKLIVPKPVGEE